MLDDGDGAIFEPGALLLHVGDLAGDTLLPPTGTHQRALVYQWVMFVLTEMEPPFVEALTRGDIPSARPSHAIGCRRSSRCSSRRSAGASSSSRTASRQPTCSWRTSSSLAKVMGGMELSPALSAYIEPHTARPARKRADELFAA